MLGCKHALIIFTTSTKGAVSVHSVIFDTEALADAAKTAIETAYPRMMKCICVQTENI